MGTAIDNPANFGPAMKALNRRQQRFVVAVLELGSTNYTRAAMLAGYEGENTVVKSTAYRLAHDEKVLAALNEEAKRRLMASAPMAISELIKLAEESNEGKIKLKAVEMILNRTGHHALTEHKVEVKHTYSDQQSIARIFALAKQMNMDPVKLLGSQGIKVDDKGQILDAEFSEVISAPEAENVGSSTQVPTEIPADEFDWKEEPHETNA